MSHSDTSSQYNASSHTDLLLSLSIEALRQGQPMHFRVASGSMRPLLQVNDSVRIEPTSTVAIGGIAAFETPDGLVIHRIVHTEQNQGKLRLLQMGDGEVRPTWIESETIVGCVTAVHKGTYTCSLETPIAQWYSVLIATLRYQVYLHRTSIPLSTFLRLCSRLLLYLWTLQIRVQSGSTFRKLFRSS